MRPARVRRGLLERGAELLLGQVGAQADALTQAADGRLENRLGPGQRPRRPGAGQLRGQQPGLGDAAAHQGGRGGGEQARPRRLVQDGEGELL
ncbi:hypothetical protein OIM90_26575 [Streptomyces sp. AD16]|nr:hypothetical protein OIM90_26575 [Streptomyces sp. AD16]